MTQAQTAFFTAASLGLKNDKKKVLNDVIRGIKETVDTNSGNIVSNDTDIATITGTLNEYADAFSVSGSDTTFSGVIVADSVEDSIGDLRVTPENAKTDAYTLTTTDVGKFINTTSGGVTVPSGVFTAGESVLVYNNSSSNQTITQATGTTLRLAGTATTGDLTLAQRGVANIFCVGSEEFTVYGAGLS